MELSRLIPDHGLVGISGFLDTYLTFREESTKDNFRIADHPDFDAEM